MLVDSHCHLDLIDLAPFDGDADALRAAARAAGVTGMLCVSVSMEAWPAMRARFDAWPEVWFSVGAHPNGREDRSPTVEELVAHARDPRVVAIGETGLDFYRSEGDLSWQHERFHRHIEAARIADLPLIVHTREARAETLAALRDASAAGVRGVMHCFTEDWETARAALDLGFYISFSGIVSFRNAEDLRAVARRVPEDRLLVETDAPWLAPLPHRGRPNQPAWVRHVAECLADVRGVDVERLAAVTTANFHRLFARTVPGEAC